MPIVPYLDTKGLTLIPFAYGARFKVAGFLGISGGVIEVNALSPSGNHWKATTSGHWISFGFKGTICGVLFLSREGVCNIYIDGVKVISNLDVSTVKGSYNFCPYIVAENLTNDYHEIKIEHVSGTIKVAGILADKRLNYWDFIPFPLKDYDHSILWNQYSAPAGATISVAPFYLPCSLGIFIQVSSATTVSLLIDTALGKKAVKNYSFSGAGYVIDIIPYWPFDSICFSTSAATVITVEYWATPLV